MTRPARLVAASLACVVLAGCGGGGSAAPASSAPTSSSPSAAQSSPTATPTPRVAPGQADVATAMAAVRHLAGDIGPRPGTSPAYREAADWVERRFEALGWQVRRQRFATPAGVSWGVPVRGGTSVNLVATRGDVRPGEPWLAVGAHLDTVPQAPGAEDNASGIGALLAVAEATAERRTRLPVVLIAFGSEEPRGPSDADHHYGSRAYVDRLGAAQRDGLRGMVALDRVGVGDVLPVSSAQDPTPLRAALLAAAQRAGVATVARTQNRASDHWSFVQAGLPGVRLGSTPYAGYHSPDDTVDVVQPDQLRRTIRTLLAWLS